jgi:hypothetical protein
MRVLNEDYMSHYETELNRAVQKRFILDRCGLKPQLKH